MIDKNTNIETKSEYVIIERGGNSVRLCCIDCADKLNGRKGKFPDMVVFGAATAEELACVKAPHYAIAGDGTVYRFVSVSDGALMLDGCTASSGLPCCRPYSAALYTVTVVFLCNDGITNNALDAASALLKLLSQKLLRIYKQKIPFDKYHIVDIGIFNEMEHLSTVPYGSLSVTSAGEIRFER